MQKQIAELKKFMEEYTPSFGARLRAPLTLIIFLRPWIIQDNLFPNVLNSLLYHNLYNQQVLVACDP